MRDFSQFVNLELKKKKLYSEYSAFLVYVDRQMLSLPLHKGRLYTFYLYQKIAASWDLDIALGHFVIIFWLPVQP